MEYSRLHNRVWGLSYEDKHRWATCYLFAEEEYMIRYNQDNTRIPTHCSTRVTQEVEDGNHLSWIRIQINRRKMRLQDRNRNNI